MSEAALFLAAFGLGWCSCLVFQRQRATRRRDGLDLTEAQRRRRAP